MKNLEAFHLGRRLREVLRHHKEIVTLGCVSVVLSVFSLRTVLFQEGIIGHTWDWGIPLFPEQFQTNLATYYYGWNPQVTMGRSVSLYNDYYYWGLLTLLSPLGGAWVSKIILVLLMVSSSLSMYSLIRRLGVSHLAGSIGSILYMLTPLMYSKIIIGHLNAVLGYAVLPLLVLLLLNATESTTLKARLKYSVLAGLALVLAGQSSYTMFDALIISGVVLLICSVFIGLRRSLVTGGIAASFFLLLNSYWILGFIAQWGQLSEVYKNRPIDVQIAFRLQATFGNTPEIYDAIRLVAPQSMFTEFVYPIPPTLFYAWLVSTVLVVGIACLSLLRRPFGLRLYVLWLLAIIGVVLTSITKTVVGLLILDSLLRVPQLYSVFTNPVRFAFIPTVAFCALFGVGAQVLLDRTSAVSRRIIFRRLRMPGVRERMVPAAALSLVIVLILLYSVPFVNGAINEPVPGHPPDQPFSLKVSPIAPEERVVYDFLRNNPEDFRVTYLPPVQLGPPVTNLSYEWTAYSSPKPEYLGATPLDNTARDMQQFTIMALYREPIVTQEIGKLLGLASVKYVILPEYDRVLYWYPLSHEVMVGNILNQTDLEDIPVSRGIGTTRVLENRDFLPHIYAPTKIYVVGGDLASLMTLSTNPLGDFGQNAFVISGNLGQQQFVETVDAAQGVVIYNDDGFEFLSSFRCEGCRIDPGKYALGGSNPESEWVNLENHWAREFRFSSLVEKSRAAFTRSMTNLTIPLGAVPNPAVVYARVYVSPGGSELRFFLNRQLIGSIQTRSPSWGPAQEIGFRWAKVDIPASAIPHSSAGHTLQIQGLGGSNAISSILLANPSLIDADRHEFESLIASKEVVLLYEAETFGAAIPRSEASMGVVAAVPGGPDSLGLEFNKTYSKNDVKNETFVVHQNGTYEISAEFEPGIRGTYILEATGLNIKTDVTPYFHVLWTSSDHIARVVAKTDTETFKIVPLGFMNPDAPFGGGYSPTWTYTVYPLPPGRNITAVEIGVDSDGFTDVMGRQSASFLLSVGSTPLLYEGTLSVPSPGEYEVFARVSAKNSSTLTFASSYGRLNTEIAGGSDRLVLVRLGTLNFVAGSVQFELSADQRDVIADWVMLRKGVQQAEGQAPSVAFDKQSPAMYKVHIRNSAVRHIVFSEGFSSLWKLTCGTEQFRPVLGYGFLNLYISEDTFPTGECSLEYETQIFYTLGHGISTSGWIAAICIVNPWGVRTRTIALIRSVARRARVRIWA